MVCYGWITKCGTSCDNNHFRRWLQTRPTYFWMFLNRQILIAPDDPTYVYLLSWQSGCQRFYSHWRNYRCQGMHRNSSMILANVHHDDGWFLFPTCYFWRRLTWSEEFRSVHTATRGRRMKKTNQIQNSQWTGKITVPVLPVCTVTWLHYLRLWSMKRK